MLEYSINLNLMGREKKGKEEVVSDGKLWIQSSGNLI